NSVMGYWMFDAHDPEGVRRFFTRMAHQPFPIPFFAAPENHNTPRAASRTGGITYAHYVLALSITLPGLPFILSGFELGETQPINTGLGFTDEQLAQYPSDKLPLFSEWAFNWTRQDQMVTSVTYALSLRQKFADVFNSNSPDHCLLGYSDNPHILVYSRTNGDRWISVIANMDQREEQRGRVVVNALGMRVPGLWGTSETGMDMYHEAMANVSLAPGYVLILDGSGKI